MSPKGTKAGVLRGWINNVLRWDYSNIATVEAGAYHRIRIDSTFNQTIYGAQQKRYWDLFSVGSGLPDHAAPA